jgi:hypothetical protein
VNRFRGFIAHIRSAFLLLVSLTIGVSRPL